jgi:hypothetical protein
MQTNDPTGFDFDAHYRVSGYGGIAWYVLGYEMIRDEDYEWSGMEYENRERVRAVMVGDDRVFVFDVEDFEPLADDEYCRDCGQIGCTSNVYI